MLYNFLCANKKFKKNQYFLSVPVLHYIHVYNIGSTFLLKFEQF